MAENRKAKAKKYEKIRLTVGITEGVISFAFLLFFLISGYSSRLDHFASRFAANPYLALLIYTGILGLVGAIFSFPVDYLFGFRLEHKFDLSNQTFMKWLAEKFKTLAVGIVLMVPILLLFYYLLRNYELWWLYLSIVILMYNVLLAQIAPIIIMPLFYKFVPVENSSLKEKIIALCERAGFKPKGVYSFDMSKNTKKANAAFTGLGKSKRIIIGDTLLSGFSEPEIEVVFAHELGHYKRGHIMKGLAVSVISSVTGLYLMSLAYSYFYSSLGFAHRYDIGALPVLAVAGAVLGFVTKPLGSYLSRRFEYEADRYAIQTTEDLVSFKSTMEKLAFQNLADTEPNRLVELIFYSHPSIKNRIAAGERYFQLQKKAK